MYESISIEEAKKRIDEDNVVLVDIRDPDSHTAAHIPDSVHLDNSKLQDFLASTDRGKSLIVYCYYGNTSQAAARFLADQGFARVYSMDGGFEQWRVQFPELCTSPADASQSD